MKVGFNISIDVTKIDKQRLYEGKKGKYANMTAFIDTENKSQYGDNGVVTQSTTKEERQNGVKLPVIGNVKVFYSDLPHETPQQPEVDDEDLPF